VPLVTVAVKFAGAFGASLGGGVSTMTGGFGCGNRASRLNQMNKPEITAKSRTTSNTNGQIGRRRMGPAGTGAFGAGAGAAFFMAIASSSAWVFPSIFKAMP
jgi:hypothetical protein